MKAKAEKKQLQEKVFITAYVIFIIKNILDSSSLVHRPEIVDSLLIMMFLVCIGYKLLTQNYSRRSFLLIIIIGILCLYSSLIIKYFSLLCSFLCICAMQDVDINKILKVSARSKVIILSIHVIAYIAVYLYKPEVIQFVYRDGVKRHYFFLGHANMFTAYLAWTCLEIIYIHYKQIKKLQLLLIWVINIVFYQFTHSNTGTIVLTVVILVILIERKDWRFIDKGLSFLSKYGFGICSILFPAIAVIYARLNGTLLMIWNWLNQGLTGRLLYGAVAYDVYGFTIFGRTISFPEKIYWSGKWIDNVVFDNSYIWMFIIFGIVNLLILSVAFFLLERKTNNMEKILIIAFTFYGIMEAYVVNVIICFPLLFIGKYIYEQKTAEKYKRLTEVHLWTSK
jgi:hypothetical protein